MSLRAGLAAGLFAVGAAVSAQALADRPRAHVHGAAKLGIAVEGGSVSVQLESPLEGLLGFEHRPTTPAQQAAVDALQKRMRDPGGLFAFDPAANCTLAAAAAESAIFEPAAKGAAGAHADLDADFTWRCAHPERLTRVEIGLFAAYPGLRRLEVEIVTAKGQFRRELRAPARTLSVTGRPSP